MPGRQLERRFVAEELRVEGRTLTGLAAPFDREARLGRLVEVIRRGAFARSLRAGVDVRALVDHDPTRLLGRTRSGTLELHEATEGLAFSIAAPATQLGDDTLELARRGDLSGMSFGFRARPDGERTRGRVRELVDVDLMEVSVITGGQPAYPDTSVSARSRELYAADLAALTRAARTAARTLSRRPR
ncbi:MAG: HK97 family phage prohead protease [Geminicoccaceae bacterium]